MNWIKNNLLILILGATVGTCTVITGYRAYARKQEKRQVAEDFEATIQSLKDKYPRSVYLEEVMRDYSFELTSTKQLAFKYPKSVILEGYLNDSEAYDGYCVVDIGEPFSDTGFKLLHQNCSDLLEYEYLDYVLVVAHLISHKNTDSTFYYKGKVLEMMKHPTD